MIKKTPLILMIAGLVTALAIIFSGCSTEDPWTTNPSVPFTFSLISGPTDSLSVPANTAVSYSWAATGGVGEVLYQYKLNDDPWSELSNITTVTFTGLAEGIYIFSVQAQDAGGHTGSSSGTFRVTPAVPAEPDTIGPYVTITQAPEEGSYVATGSTIAFAWDGYDSTGSGADLLFRYTFAGNTSAWTPARTVAFDNVASANPAVFEVVARDASGNGSAPAISTFIIRTASVLYVDDYQWLDPFQNVNRVKEREQKAFYRDVLTGYAFAEWEIATQGMPDSAFILQFSTVVFASDSHLGDASGTWWFDVGSVGGGVLRYYMENGGHLLAAGANILQWIYNSNPPSAGDFEYDWFGLDTTGGWDYWGDFTWAVNAGNFTTIPDSMKIDVGKNGDQVDIAEDIFGFREGVTVMYVKGLDIDGAEPNDYGVSVGHVYHPGGGAARSALIDFDAFSMPLPGIRETFHTILDQFGEGPGL